MSAPPKPWEGAGVNNARAGASTFSPQMSSGLPDPVTIPDAARPLPTAGPTGYSAPPPVATRPRQQLSNISGYGGYSGAGSYGSYGGLGYGGVGSMYGSGMYGGYGCGPGYGGYGMNRFGTTNEPYGRNSFAQQAEESSRQAFQSIESIVQAFGSVAMMLESTFSAVYNSFRAVIGVADHFTRMKTHFAQIFSALAVIKTLRWLYRKLLVLLKLKQPGLDEDLWAQAAESELSSLLDTDGGGGGGKSSWPILLFFAVVLGGPYLIWRLLKSMGGSQESDWAGGVTDHFVAVAEYDFVGEGDDELSFKKGQHMNVAPKELQPRVRGWLLASVGGKKVGMVPANYVKVLGRRKGHGRLKNPAQQAVHSTAETVARGVSQSSSVSSVSSASSQNFNNAFAPSASKQSGTISTSKLEDDYANIFDKASVIDRTASDILQENCTEDTAG